MDVTVTDFDELEGLAHARYEELGHLRVTLENQTQSRAYEKAYELCKQIREANSPVKDFAKGFGLLGAGLLSMVGAVVGDVADERKLRSLATELRDLCELHRSLHAVAGEWDPVRVSDSALLLTFNHFRYASSLKKIDKFGLGWKGGYPP